MLLWLEDVDVAVVLDDDAVEVELFADAAAEALVGVVGQSIVETGESCHLKWCSIGSITYSSFFQIETDVAFWADGLWTQHACEMPLIIMYYQLIM